MKSTLVFGLALAMAAGVVWTAPHPAVVMGRSEHLVDRAAAAAAVVSKRTDGDVVSATIELCTGTSKGGDCTGLSFDLTVGALAPCFTLPAEVFRQLGSVYPTPGVLCRLTTTSSTTTCSAHGDLFIDNEGVDDLFNYDGTAVDQGHEARFISCVPCSACV